MAKSKDVQAFFWDALWELKKQVADMVIPNLEPFQQRYRHITSSSSGYKS